MKCPQCGYVSFPDLSECKNCGYRFAKPQNTMSAQDLDSVLLQNHSRGQATLSSCLESALEITSTPPSKPSNRAPGEKREEKSSSPQATPHLASDMETGWGEDLSERVASYRRRRSEQETLQFDFGSESDIKGPMPTSSQQRSQSVSSGAGTLDKAFDERADRRSRINLESIPLETHQPDVPARARRSQPPPIRPAGATRLESNPLDLVDTSLTAESRLQDSDYPDVICAPIGKRFAAGVIDAVVLALAGCLFTLLFDVVLRLAGGSSVQTRSINLVVIVFLAAFWIFAYFALFSAISFSTPGQAAMGLSVRTLEGNLPTLQEALLRAFGYLVSVGSMMLGFLWAVMDSDGLAWHDHISGTLLIED